MFSVFVLVLIRLRRLESAHARHSLSKLNSALAYSQISLSSSSSSFLLCPPETGGTSAAEGVDITLNSKL